MLCPSGGGGGGDLKCYSMDFYSNVPLVITYNMYLSELVGVL